MAWRVARSIGTLRSQVNAAWPDRNRASDGTIGDTAHSSRRSDHNPNAAGVVCAIDITHDPAAGADMHALAEAIKHDPRVKYLIFNARIWNPSVSASWRRYSGSNAHRVHMHVSVVGNAAAYDNTSPWALAGGTVTTEEDDVLKRGEKDKAKVTVLQWRLNQEHPAHPVHKGERLGDPRSAKLDYGLVVDGDFGGKTEAYVQDFQARHGYSVDGVVDLATYIRLLERNVQWGAIRVGA